MRWALLRDLLYLRSRLYGLDRGLRRRSRALVLYRRGPDWLTVEDGHGEPVLRWLNLGLHGLHWFALALIALVVTIATIPAVVVLRWHRWLGGQCCRRLRVAQPIAWGFIATPGTLWIAGDCASLRYGAVGLRASVAAQCG